MKASPSPNAIVQEARTATCQDEIWFFSFWLPLNRELLSIAYPFLQKY